MNSYDFFIYEFICFMNSYMNSGVPRFQMPAGSWQGPATAGIVQSFWWSDHGGETPPGARGIKGVVTFFNDVFYFKFFLKNLYTRAKAWSVTQQPKVASSSIVCLKSESWFAGCRALWRTLVWQDIWFLFVQLGCVAEFILICP